MEVQKIYWTKDVERKTTELMQKKKKKEKEQKNERKEPPTIVPNLPFMK